MASATADPANPSPPTQDEEDDAYDEDGALIPSDTYDGLVCAACVASSSILRDKAGTSGYMMIVPREDDTMEVIGREDENAAASGTGTVPSAATLCEAPRSDANDKAATSTEALMSPDTDQRPAQNGDTSASSGRPKDGPSASASSTESGHGIRSADAEPDKHPVKKRRTDQTELIMKGRGDIFLADGIRETLAKELTVSIKRSLCLSSPVARPRELTDAQAEQQASLPFPLIDDEIYEPRKDEEPEETLEEATERVVGSMPRINAIEALHGYARIR